MRSKPRLLCAHSKDSFALFLKNEQEREREGKRERGKECDITGK
jgi:hypothetical protein